MPSSLLHDDLRDPCFSAPPSYDRSHGARDSEFGPEIRDVVTRLRAKRGGIFRGTGYNPHHAKGFAGLDPADGHELWNVPWETPYDVNACGAPARERRGLHHIRLRRRRTAAKDPAAPPPGLSGETRPSLRTTGDPFVIDGYMYGYSGASYQNRGRFKCVEFQTGEEKWSTGEIGWGTTVWADGHLLCMDTKGNLFLVKPDPARFRISRKSSERPWVTSGDRLGRFPSSQPICVSSRR